MLNFRGPYSKYKDSIFEEIIAEFGEEDRDVISPRLDDFSIFFQSNPIEDYVFMLLMRMKKEPLSFVDTLRIKHNSKKFEQAE